MIACGAAWADYGQLPPSSPVYEIHAASEGLEMTVHTSRIFTLSPQLTQANRIPQAQVTNPEILGVTPLSPTEILVAAKKPGVTQVVLWDENNQVYTVNVIVFGDAQELSLLLKSEFPNAALKVKPLKDSVLISGYVDQPQHVSTIRDIAQHYYPQVLTNMSVGGVHQVLLHIKVVEVSRTKLRSLGLDWQAFGSDFSLTVTGAGVLEGFQTVELVAEDFLAVVEALRKDQLAKVLSEPTLVTYSGRPAYFHVGGEIGYVESVDNRGVAQIGWKDFGTRVDFVPITLGNGRVRLEVRPSVSEVDRANSFEDKPAIKIRTADTGVELAAGQTLAIAGLVQERLEAERKGIPWLSELPYVGPLFGRIEERVNEVELVILVTPEIVAGMSPEEVPACLPGMATDSPSDCELYLKRYLEVPRCCPPGSPGTIPYKAGEALSPEQVHPPAPMPADSPSAGRRRGTTAFSAATSRPTDRQNPSGPHNRAATARPGPASKPQLPGFMGPIGYDAGE